MILLRQVAGTTNVNLVPWRLLILLHELRRRVKFIRLRIAEPATSRRYVENHCTIAVSTGVYTDVHAII